ncbi:MAG: hypothetical protein Q3979_05140 [Actinomycetaceae bacterium]|nr:hypothetical protein [Actinomycetaceae bacterium]
MRPEPHRLQGGVGVDGVVVGSRSASEHLKLVTYGGGVVGIAGRPEPNPPGFTTAPSLHEVAL